MDRTQAPIVESSTSKGAELAVVGKEEDKDQKDLQEPNDWLKTKAWEREESWDDGPSILERWPPVWEQYHKGSGNTTTKSSI